LSKRVVGGVGEGNSFLVHLLQTRTKT